MLPHKTQTSAPRPRMLSTWLFVVAAMIVLMVAVGGITRLTESGLSMVRWEPISGAVPPLNDAQWQELFEKYQNDFALLNRVLDAYEPAANRIANTVAVSFVEERERVIGQQQDAIQFSKLQFVRLASIRSSHSGVTKTTTDNGDAR